MADAVVIGDQDPQGPRASMLKRAIGSSLGRAKKWGVGSVGLTVADAVVVGDQDPRGPRVLGVPDLGDEGAVPSVHQQDEGGLPCRHLEQRKRG